MKVLDPLEDTFQPNTESTMSKFTKTQKHNQPFFNKVNKNRNMENKQNEMLVQVNKQFIQNLYKLEKFKQQMKDE
tara:strand:- start:499 stop:723 length:225 start_codon:yes stop_codon:yes gene_type:complete